MDQTARKSFTLGIVASFGLLLVVLAGLIFAVPRFELVFHELERPVPALTRLIFIGSHFAQSFFFIPILLYGAAAAVVFRNQWQCDARVRVILWGHALLMVLLLATILVGLFLALPSIIEPVNAP